MANRGQIRLNDAILKWKGKRFYMERFAFDVMRNCAMRLEKNAKSCFAVWEGPEENDYGSDDFFKAVSNYIFRFQILKRNDWNGSFNVSLDELKSAKTFKSISNRLGKFHIKATREFKYDIFRSFASSLAVTCEFVLFLYSINLEMHMKEVARFWFESYFKLIKTKFVRKHGLMGLYEIGTCELYAVEEKFLDTFLSAHMVGYENSLKKHVAEQYEKSVRIFLQKRGIETGEEFNDFYLQTQREDACVSSPTSKPSSEMDVPVNTGLGIRPHEEMLREVGVTFADDATSARNLTRDPPTHRRGSSGQQKLRKYKSNLSSNVGKDIGQLKPDDSETGALEGTDDEFLSTEEYIRLVNAKVSEMADTDRTGSSAVQMRLKAKLNQSPNMGKDIGQSRLDDSKTDVTENTGLGTRPIEEILPDVGADVADKKYPQNLFRDSPTQNQESAGRKKKKKGKSSLSPNVEKGIGQIRQDDPEIDLSENTGLGLRPHEKKLGADVTSPQNLARDSPTQNQESAGRKKKKKGKSSLSPNVEKGIVQTRQDDPEIDLSENTGLGQRPHEKKLCAAGADVTSPQNLARYSPTHCRGSAGRQKGQKGKYMGKCSGKLDFDTSEIKEATSPQNLAGASSRDSPKQSGRSSGHQSKSILSPSEHKDIGDLSLDLSPMEKSLYKKFSDVEAYDIFTNQLLSIVDEESLVKYRESFRQCRKEGSSLSSSVKKGFGEIKKDESEINVSENTGRPHEEILPEVGAANANDTLPHSPTRDSPTQRRGSFNQQKKLKSESSMSPNVEKGIGHLKLDTSEMDDATSPQNLTGANSRDSPERSGESCGQNSTIKIKSSLSSSVQKCIGVSTVPSGMSPALMFKMFKDSETFDEFCHKVMSFYNDIPVEENEESQNIINSPPVSVAVIADDTSTQILAQDSTIQSAGQEGKYVEKGLRELGLDTSDIDEATSPQNLSEASSRESSEHSGRLSGRQSKSILSPSVQKDIGELRLDSSPKEQSLHKIFSDAEAFDLLNKQFLSSDSEESVVECRESSSQDRRQNIADSPSGTFADDTFTHTQPVEEYREPSSQDRGQNVANSPPGSVADDATSPERFTGARPKDSARMQRGSSGWQKSRSKLNPKEKKDTEK